VGNMRTLLGCAGAACGVLILSAMGNIGCQGRIGDAIDPRDPGGRTTGAGAGAGSTGTGATSGGSTTTGSPPPTHHARPRGRGECKDQIDPRRGHWTIHEDLGPGRAADRARLAEHLELIRQMETRRVGTYLSSRRARPINYRNIWLMDLPQ
jgi:hypothetical protein